VFLKPSQSALAIFIKIDITNVDSIRRAAEEFSKQSDRLDALVNNAGILLDHDKDILTMTSEIFETTLRTNTLGALLVSQEFVPFLKKSDAPRIVNVSSGGGHGLDSRAALPRSSGHCSGGT
jgi:NAD(P)-dependent dehydrogenase (short-subunit alcohol dehydrogenase family)